MVAQLPQRQTQPLLEKREPAKSQLLSCLAICLATSALLATTQAKTFAQSAESHMEAEAALNLVCVKKSQYFICRQENKTQPGDDSLQNQGTAGATRITATIVPQLLSPAQQELMANILIGLSYLLPAGLGLGIYIYDRYADYRCSILKQQVETLERIWERSPLH